MLGRFYRQIEIVKRIGKKKECISKELTGYVYKGVY